MSWSEPIPFEELERIAERLAQAGYAVVTANPADEAVALSRDPDRLAARCVEEFPDFSDVTTFALEIRYMNGLRLQRERDLERARAGAA